MDFSSSEYSENYSNIVVISTITTKINLAQHKLLFNSPEHETWTQVMHVLSFSQIKIGTSMIQNGVFPLIPFATCTPHQPKLMKEMHICYPCSISSEEECHDWVILPPSLYVFHRRKSQQVSNLFGPSLENCRWVHILDMDISLIINSHTVSAMKAPHAFWHKSHAQTPGH